VIDEISVPAYDEVRSIRYWLVSKWPVEAERPLYLRFNLAGETETTEKPSLAMRYHEEDTAYHIAARLGMPWFATAVDFRRDAMVGS
jgi:hypothetical protein